LIEGSKNINFQFPTPFNFFLNFKCIKLCYFFRYEEAIGIKRKVLELYGSLDNFVMMYKVVLGLVVVYLHESDYIAADKCFKDSFR
jgi:hypothetical protein